MTSPLLCAALEIALNRYLRLEPGVLEECARLRGRGIEVSLTAPSLSFLIEFIDGGVRVMPPTASEAQVRVRGSATQFLRFLRRLVAGEEGLPVGLDVEGDAELLQRFRAMLERVGFDAEEWLAPIFGGAAAHRLVGGLQRMLGWTRGSGERLAANTAEYLREETYDLARKADVEDWSADVEDMRESVDRLEARLRLLEEGSRPKIAQRTRRRDGG